MALRGLFRKFSVLPISGSSQLCCVKGVGYNVNATRSVVLPPEKWYFLDTEGNLQHGEQKGRHRIQNVPANQVDQFSLENVENLLHDLKGDMPIQDMPDPYKKAKMKCILCRHDVDVNFKNARLLSQFVSRWTGKLYDRQTTGLCRYQSERVIDAVKIARAAGYMPRIYTEPIYYHDPRLFDPFRPTRKS